MRNLILFILLVFLLGCSTNEKVIPKKNLDEVSAKVLVLEMKLKEVNLKITEIEKKLGKTSENDEIKLLERKILSLSEMINVLSVKIEKVKEIRQKVRVKEVIPQDYVKKTEVEKKYNKARREYLSRNYKKALNDFRELINNFPQHKLAVNSQYWRGECFYDQEQYKKAIDEFQKVVDFYPNSNKIFDAHIKIALCFKEEGKYQEAKHELQTVIRKFPKDKRVDLAKKILEEL